MAELNYGDVTRAVQDGVRNLRADVQRLSHQTQGISDIQRAVQALQIEVQRMEYIQGQSGSANQRVAGLLGEVREIKTRLASIEKFCAAMGSYMAARAEQEEEDNEYRSAT